MRIISRLCLAGSVLLGSSGLAVAGSVIAALPPGGEPATEEVLEPSGWLDSLLAGQLATANGLVVVLAESPVFRDLDPVAAAVPAAEPLPDSSLPPSLLDDPGFLD